MATHSSILAWEILWTEESGVYCETAKNQTQLNNKKQTKRSTFTICIIIPM